MKILSHTGKEVYVGHFQGNAMKQSMEIVEEYSSKPININPRITVITAYTDKEKALTALQLELSNMPYINACPSEVVKWTNIDKIKYYVNTLSQTTSEYSLLVDGYDVLFFKDLDEEFITKFEQMNKSVIYNATKNNHPNITLDIENKQNLGEFKYLNAGVAFGKTSELLKLYIEILAQTKRKDIMNPWNSEQLYVRLAVEKKEEIGIDNECQIFQTLSKTTKTICGNIVVID